MQMTPEAAARVQKSGRNLVVSEDRVDNEPITDSEEEEEVEVPYTYEVRIVFIADSRGSLQNLV